MSIGIIYYHKVVPIIIAALISEVGMHNGTHLFNNPINNFFIMYLQSMSHREYCVPNA